MAIDFSNTEFEAEGLEEPLVTTSLTREDEGEYSLRPKTLREYIGQEKAKGNLEVFIQAAKMRHEPLDHVLLHGPPGLGKTTLSGIIANEMGGSLTIAVCKTAEQNCAALCAGFRREPGAQAATQKRIL